jgi:hypothetical protein
VFFAYSQTTQENLKRLAAKKYFTPETAERLFDIFMKCPGDLHHRTTISEILVDGGGVLNLRKFNGYGTGTLNDLIMTKYRNDIVVQALVKRLKRMKDLPTQDSAAAKGVGEDLLLVLGDPVYKLSPGDLNINGREIEIKAMGARLKGFGGAKIYGDASTAYKQWANLVGQALGPDGNAVMAQYGFALSNRGYQHFSKIMLTALSDGLAVSKVRGKADLMIAAFDLLLSTLYVQSTPEMRKMVTDTFKGGKLDVELLRKNWVLFNYDYYKFTTKDKSSGTPLEGIFFLNQATDKWILITDKKELDANFDEFQIGSDLFNWTNATGQAPKMSYGKEIREKSAKAKEAQKARYAAKKAAGTLPKKKKQS